MLGRLSFLAIASTILMLAVQITGFVGLLPGACKRAADIQNSMYQWPFVRTGTEGPTRRVSFDGHKRRYKVVPLLQCGILNIFFNTLTHAGRQNFLVFISIVCEEE